MRKENKRQGLRFLPIALSYIFGGIANMVGLVWYIQIPSTAGTLAVLYYLSDFIDRKYKK